MVFVETSFPRGGTLKPASDDAVPVSAALAQPDVEFGATTFKRKKEKLNKKQREEKQIRANEEQRTDKIEAVSAELLSLKTVTEGMLIMGCISKIDATFLQVSLPGRLTGRVLVTAMAPAYVDIVNKYVNDMDNVLGYKTLDELYTIGQIVCVKVTHIRAGPDQPRALIELSMNPADLQADFQHKQIAADALLCAAVTDIEDHGYVLCTGIANLRAFLPLAEASGRDLAIGQILFVRVQTLKSAAAASTAVCTLADALADRKPVLAKGAPNLSHVLPTALVPFKVSKVLRDGLQGTVFGDAFTAYANEHQLERPLAQPGDYEVGAVLQARVLYVMPLTKLVYVSLMLSDSIARSDGQLTVGTIVEEARVLRVGAGGLVVRLGQRHKGLISFRSLRAGAAFRSNFDTDELMAKYHKNSVHRVRVTGYDPMDALYVCTTSERLLAEKHFTVDDLAVGDRVDATLVHSVAEGGFFARVGQVKAYLERVQISASTPTEKLREGARLRCRVLRKHAKDQKVFLTNRKEWMADDAELLSTADPQAVGRQFLGMVVKIFADGYLVSFGQYVKGMLYRRNLSEEDASTAAYFRVGQIAKFCVASVRRDGSIALSLGKFVCQVGTVLAGKVTTVDANGLNVAYPDARLNGFVPAMLLTATASLRPLMHQTYRANEPLDAVCVAQNVYSVRDVAYVREHPVRRWADVRQGDLLPAYVKDVRGDVVELMCLVEQYAKIVKCHVKMLLEDFRRETRIDLVPEQLLYVRVLGKNDMLQTLTVSARLSHVWTGDLRDTAGQLRQYFADVDRVRAYCVKIQNALGAVQAGSVLKARVVQVDAERATLRLPEGVTGVLTQRATGEPRVQPNESLEVLVIWVDFVENVVHVTANREYIERVGKLPALDAHGKVVLAKADDLQADVLLVAETVAVLLPRKYTNRFVYMPTRLHYNDLQPVVLNGVRVGDVVDVAAIDVDDEHTIGIFREIHEMFGQLRERRERDRRLREILDAVKEESGDEDDAEKGLLEPKTEDEDEEVGAESAVPVYSGDVVKTEYTEDDDNDAEVGALDASELFFEDTLGKNEQDKAPVQAIKSKAGKRKTKKSGKAAANGAKNSTAVAVAEPKKAEKRKLPANAGKTNEKKTKSKTGARIAQLDGLTEGLSDDSDSDGDYDAPKKSLVALPKKAKRKFEKANKPNVLGPKLPGASNFWSTDLAAAKKARKSLAPVLSSDDEDDGRSKAGKSKAGAKKTKLSTAERFRVARNEEERIRSIEERNANPDGQPSSVEHHERLVMATPNSSLAWINYMVFHMQCNEIHRARLVARKAFKKISVRDSEELLNVWIALLNLELRYGDKETFDGVFVEATRANDPFKVYSRTLQMLTNVEKTEELVDLVDKYTKKFRSVPDCWPNAAAALFAVGLVAKAQPQLNRALQSLPERDHISTILKFASLNNKHNNRDRAHALMEQILTAYPKRVDCWSQYVDMMVKDNEIDIARQILDRAIAQSIPIKKMRTMFKKYLDFEERFGSIDSVQKVKAMAASYVEKELKA